MTDLIDTAAMDLVLTVSDILGFTGDERRAAEFIAARLESAYRAGHAEALKKAARYVGQYDFIGVYEVCKAIRALQIEEREK